MLIVLLYDAKSLGAVSGEKNNQNFFLEEKAMRTFITVVLAVAGMMMLAVGADAATKILPAGAKVSATVANDGTAQLVVTGVKTEQIEYYSYEGVKTFKEGKSSINLREGRRFQVVFDGGHYALLTPEMSAVPHPEFFGPGVGLDCSNQGGCCFIVTGK